MIICSCVTCTCVTTTDFKPFTATPAVNTFTDHLPIYSKAVTIECVSYIQTNVFSDDILPHLNLEWVGVQLVSDSTVTVGEQRIEDSTVIRDLTFNSLKYSHSGQYVCRAALNTSSDLFTTEANHTLMISSKL